MAGAALERVLQHLTGIKKISSGWVARCPAHDDHVQSLQISERDDLSVGLFCHAGCSKPALLDAMGLGFSDLYTSTEKQIVGTYDYRDLTGTLLYQAVRFYPKEFRQRRPDPAAEDGWAWNMTPLKGKHIAYRLPDLKGHNRVVIVEGEKDADRLWKCGIAATTNIGGAMKWGPGETKSLVAAGVSHVVVIPDNDEAGKKHADQVVLMAKKHNLAYSVLELDDLPEHGDVSDWLANGGSPEALQMKIDGKASIHVVPPSAPAVAAPAPVVTPSDILDAKAYHMTDLGVAESFRDRFGDRLRYDHQRKGWLIWDGHYWRPDQNDGAYRMAHEHIRLMQRDALLLSEFSARRTYLDFAMGREKRGPVMAMMGHATALLPFAVVGDEWDLNPWLLGVPNGVVDLKTGTLRPGERTDFITLKAGADYVHAECPRWMKFLDEVFDGDAVLIDYVWRAVGYSLTGDMSGQCFFVAFGSGSNGKSIFIDALENMFGTYARRSDMRTFAGTSEDQNQFMTAEFRGKRLVLAAEVKPNSRMNEHVLKHYTGGESLRGEYKYGTSFTFHPVCKIWLSVNHKPKVADDSYGFWRRVRMIPFLRTFAGSSDDPNLRQTLRAEAPGILQWAVQGCLEWQQRGLEAPEIVRQATNEYQQTEDPLGQFIESRIRCDESTATTVVSFQRLYMAYRDWANSMGLAEREKLTTRAFVQLLQSRGIPKVAGGYQGIDIISTSLYS